MFLILQKEKKKKTPTMFDSRWDDLDNVYV